MSFKLQPYSIRVVYIVPKDRQSWPDARRRATEWLEDIQWFFADEMQRLGHNSKTFEIARDTNDALVFHEISSPMQSAEFEKDAVNAVNNCKCVASDHGLRCGSDVVVYFFESYSIVAGAVHGAVARGVRWGSGGEAFMSSLFLKMARREWLASNEAYGGMVFDWISPDPMKPDTLSWHRRGKALGDVSGSAYGVMTHELGHAFGLSHDMIGDANRKGNLMGNGCRGMRGYFVPTFTLDRCVLGQPSAAVLNQSRYFAVRQLRPKSPAIAT